MSVYLPRSAVSPTMSARSWPRATKVRPKGASTMTRPASVASSRPMARVKVRVRVRSAMGHLRGFQFGLQRIPFVGLDPDEVGLLAPLQGRYAFSRQCAHDNGMGFAVRPP